MTEQEITQARSDVDQLDIEQLRCGVLLQLLHIEALKKQRDELRLQIDIQAGSIEAVQSANQRLAANHKECVRCLGEALQDTANVSVERDALAADAARYRFITDHIVDEGDMDVLERAVESLGDSETCTQAEFDACIDAAIVKEQRQAGVQ